MSQQTILVTGAQGNLGKVVCRHFLDRGYQVVATTTQAKPLPAGEAHPLLHFKKVDLANPEEVDRVVGEVFAEFGRLDAALMLAGGFAMGSLQERDPSLMKTQMALNFETAYYLTQALLGPMLRQGRGRLVYIGARPALIPGQGKNMVAYALSKSLVFRLAELVNETGKGHGLTATVLVPSTIDTAANRQAMPDAKVETWVKPEALAEIMEFVVSEKGDALRETVLKVYQDA